ncbi:MAG: clostripain-related cysteine peptidase [Elusimicrobiaceae bacterium]
MSLLKNIFTASCLLALAASSPYCAENPALTDLQSGSPAADEITAPRVTSKPPAEWTVMTYICAKNNLDASALININMMEEVGSTGQVNAVVEIGRMKPGAPENGDANHWTGIRRYYIQRDTEPAVIHSPVVMKLRYRDMGDYNRVADFVLWAKQNYPAKKYMLILWNHGSGWQDPIISKPAHEGISFDDETGNYIRTKQLGEIFKRAGKVDVLAMDACLMQQLEVAYEIKDYAKVFVASEETEPGYGYYYAGLLTLLNKSAALGADAAGKAIVSSYGYFYQQPSQAMESATQSALNLAQLTTLMQALNEWTDTAVKSGDLKALKAARDKTMRFGKGSGVKYELITYGDLYHFVDLAGKYTADKPLKAATSKLKNLIRGAVIAKSASGKAMNGEPIAQAQGLGINIPRIQQTANDSNYDAKLIETLYSGLNFAKASKWVNFFYWMSQNVK